MAQAQHSPRTCSIFCYAVRREEEQEQTMQPFQAARTPVPPAQVVQTPKAQSKPAKPQADLAALTLMYAYYDAA
jgi:hypothetical protein